MAQKIVFFKYLVLSVLLYAMESLVLTEAQLSRLETFQNRTLRRILRQPAQIEHTPNVEVRTQAKVHSVQSTLLLRRLKWWQAVLRDEEAVGVRLAIFGTLPWDATLQSPETSQR